MKFQELYTTNEKINAEKTKPEKEQKEKFKAVLSNDAFALGSVLEQFKKSLLSAIRGMAK